MGTAIQMDDRGRIVQQAIYAEHLGSDSFRRILATVVERFAYDCERNLSEKRETWSQEDLLENSGIYYPKDVRYLQWMVKTRLFLTLREDGGMTVTEHLARYLALFLACRLGRADREQFRMYLGINLSSLGNFWDQLLRDERNVVGPFRLDALKDSTPVRREPSRAAKPVSLIPSPNQVRFVRQEFPEMKIPEDVLWDSFLAEVELYEEFLGKVEAWYGRLPGLAVSDDDHPSIPLPPPPSDDMELLPTNWLQEALGASEVFPVSGVTANPLDALAVYRDVNQNRDRYVSDALGKKILTLVGRFGPTTPQWLAEGLKLSVEEIDAHLHDYSTRARVSKKGALYLVEGRRGEFKMHPVRPSREGLRIAIPAHIEAYGPRTIQELSDRLGVSRTLVREALKDLSEEVVKTHGSYDLRGSNG